MKVGLPGCRSPAVLSSRTGAVSGFTAGVANPVVKPYGLAYKESKGQARCPTEGRAAPR